jgi:hypothetical protein
MITRLCFAFAASLLIVRLPSVVQPMGADQALYAYVGERILAGDLPYRDAWDQKPPAIHYTYALLRAIWHGDGIVAAADLAAAGFVAWLLFRLGARLDSRPAGIAAALLFLLLSNPAFTRLAGVRLRAQSETFIASAVTGAFLLLARSRASRSPAALTGAGVLFGTAAMFKYNAAVYVIAGVAALGVWKRLSWASLARVAIGFCIPVAVLLGVFVIAGALRPMYDATIAYNLEYSGETYAGPLHAVRYLLTFPIDRSRVDALWTLGCGGCAVLIAAAAGGRHRLVAPLWVAAACLSIVINGSRGLPQYFVQANPPLALAAAWAGTLGWSAICRRLGYMAPMMGATVIVLIAIAVWRVNQFPKLFEQTLFDARYAAGRMARQEHLARYADERKYSALAAEQLSEYLRSHSTPTERVYVFGFTCAAYIYANRASASRFFWSRPVIVGFNEHEPGYGPAGLLADLERNRPAVVALQRNDWTPDTDSAEYFLATPALADWLTRHYVRGIGPHDFDMWLRKPETR